MWKSERRMFLALMLITASSLVAQTVPCPIATNSSSEMVQRLGAAAGAQLAVTRDGLTPDKRGIQIADSMEISRVLLQQRDAWNRGDVECYMEGYEKSDSILFVGKNVTRGWASTLANYKRGYPDRARMGTLAFDSLRILVTSPTDAYVLGHWQLTRDTTSGGNTGGWYTLIFRRTAVGWRIVVDHTS